jgi:hypothetical protein
MTQVNHLLLKHRKGIISAPFSSTHEEDMKDFYFIPCYDKRRIPSSKISIFEE